MRINTGGASAPTIPPADSRVNAVDTAGHRHAREQRWWQCVAVRYAEQLHPRLHPMRRVGRAGLYKGPCPFCADGGDDRFHVWMAASGGRPARRYRCRVCDQRGLLKNLDRDEAPWQPEARQAPALFSRLRAEPNQAHTPFYRQLY